MEVDCAKTATFGLDLRQPKTPGSPRQNPLIPPHHWGNGKLLAKFRTFMPTATTARDKLNRP
jgi:hypothetical protein